MLDETQVQEQMKKLNDLWDEILKIRAAYGAARKDDERMDYYQRLAQLNQQFGICWSALDHMGHFPAARKGGGFM